MFITQVKRFTILRLDGQHGEVSAKNLGDALWRWNEMGQPVTGLDLRGHSLRGAPLAGMDLGGSDFTGADLSDVNLSGTNLSGALMTDTLLTGAVLYETTFTPGSLSLEQLRAADLSGIIGALFRELDGGMRRMQAGEEAYPAADRGQRHPGLRHWVEQLGTGADDPARRLLGEWLAHWETRPSPGGMGAAQGAGRGA